MESVDGDHRETRRHISSNLYAYTAMMHFHSQFGEDQFLWNNYEDYFSVPRFYVDCGAASPVHGSNTSWLRSLGWRGLHIDGDNSWADQWPEGEFIHAILHTDPRVRFESNPTACLSRVSEAGMEVEAHRLDEILFAHHVDKIGFMSVDVEGQETTVLKSMALFPAHNWPPFIISEFNTYGIGIDYSACEYLLARGYKVIHQNESNMIYYDESRI